MPTSAIDSLIFRDIFGDPEVRAIWSDENRTQRYMDFEAALARAQASIGMIPKEAAAEITRGEAFTAAEVRERRNLLTAEDWRRRISAAVWRCTRTSSTGSSSDTLALSAASRSAARPAFWKAISEESTE